MRPAERGPFGDPARHLPLAALEAALAALAPASPTSGRVALLVRRRADGERETPARAWLTRAEGLAGDDWHRRPPRDPEAQLAVLRRDVAELVANGQPLALFGDNLLVDLDLAAAHQAPGACFRVGAALVEATAKPHDGCAKFRQRFGADALRFVQAPTTRACNLRGVYWKVVEDGEVAVGDPIERVAGGGRG